MENNDFDIIFLSKNQKFSNNFDDDVYLRFLSYIDKCIQIFVEMFEIQ